MNDSNENITKFYDDLEQKDLDSKNIDYFGGKWIHFLIIALISIISYFIIMEGLANYISAFFVDKVFSANNLTLDAYRGYINNGTTLPGIYQNAVNRISALNNLSIYLLLFVVIGLINFIILKKDFISFKNIKSSDKYRKIFLYFFIGLGISIASNIIVEIFSTALHYDSSISQNQEHINALFSNNINIFCIMVSSILIAPLIEELVFRKSIFAIFKNKKFAIIISAICFALLHVLDDEGFTVKMLVMAIPYFNMGLWLSYIYKKEKCNIVFNFGAHMLNNLFAGLMQLLTLYNFMK